MDPMIGMIFSVPWNWAPLNYQLCQGQTMPINQYQALYSLMGSVFGGNGSTEFKLPALQGRAPIGTGTLGTAHFTLANAGGVQSVALSQANLPVHTHGATFVPTYGPQVVTIPGTTGTQSVGVTLNATTNTTAQNIPGAPNTWLGAPSSTGVKMYAPAGGTNVALSGVTATISGSPSTPATPVTISAVSGGSVAIGAAGGSQAFATQSPYLALSFIIAINGLYPDRP